MRVDDVAGIIRQAYLLERLLPQAEDVWNRLAVRVRLLLIGPGRYCYGSPRQRMPSDSINQGTKRVSMTWRRQYLPGPSCL